ncbi:pentapeptide repeat-containing protein [bacterium]|nr:pentapeptide repeat-containing protein [bacterium]
MTDFDDEKKEYFSMRFTNLNHSGKEICFKVFEDCTFEGCNFNEAIFNKCKFVDCHFVKCNLSVLKVDYSKFTDVVFDECKVIGIDWTKASWANFTFCSPIKFHKSILNDSSFFGLKLKEIVIEECKAHDVDFRDGDFSEANFTHTDFSNSLFNKTNLSGADFTEATNYYFDIYFNDIKRAKFCRYEAVNLLESLGIELVD